jgi:hypothetical protein
VDMNAREKSAAPRRQTGAAWTSRRDRSHTATNRQTGCGAAQQRATVRITEPDYRRSAKVPIGHNNRACAPAQTIQP